MDFTYEFTANLSSAIVAPCWLALLYCVAPVRAWLARAPLGARLFLPVSVILLAVGQGLGTSERTYPLAHWHMFSSANPQHRYAFHDLEGTTRQGHTVRLKPGVLFPSVARHLLLTRLQATFSPLPRPPAQGILSQAQNEKVRDSMAALAKRYNHLHPGDPLVRLRLSRVHLQFEAASGDFRLDPIVLLEHPVDPA